MKTTSTVRDQLVELGIGQFAATMVIPYMFIAPSTTDPKASQVILLVQAIQRLLFRLGATDVMLSGRLDDPTARALAAIVGPEWMATTWSGNVARVLAFRDGGGRLKGPESSVRMRVPVPASGVGGALDFLPDVPGGIVTYAVGGFLLYRALKKRRASP